VKTLNGSAHASLFFGRHEGLPPKARINAGQKLHHATTFLMFITVAISGLCSLFGERATRSGWFLAYAAMVHDLSIAWLDCVMIGHLYLRFLYEAA